MKKQFLCPLFVTKGAFAIVCIFSLLSLASASVASYEEVLTGCFHKENKYSFKVLLTEAIEIPSLLFGQEGSFPSTGNREEVSKHLEKLSLFLHYSSRHPCRFQSLPACSNCFFGVCHSCSAARRKKGDAQNHLRFFYWNFDHTYAYRNNYTFDCQYYA